MTTDNFAQAARAEAERQNPVPPTYDPEGPSQWERLLAQQAFRNGAEWGRDQALAQEPTDAEVLAALNADYALRFGPSNLPADSLEPYGDEHVQIMRAALVAAKEARR